MCYLIFLFGTSRNLHSTICILAQFPDNSLQFGRPASNVTGISSNYQIIFLLFSLHKITKRRDPVVIIMEQLSVITVLFVVEGDKTAEQ